MVPLMAEFVIFDTKWSFSAGDPLRFTILETISCTPRCFGGMQHNCTYDRVFQNDRYSSQDIVKTVRIIVELKSCLLIS